MRQFKVYQCNYDGVRQRLVSAESMTAAARLMGVPYHHFREYGHETGNAESCRLALLHPGVVYESPSTTSNEWVEVESHGSKSKSK